MSYSIGEVSKLLNLPIPTLRYYDKEGLLPTLKRTESGIRVFSDLDLDALHIIECLKATNMPIKEIKEFMEWCEVGDDTLKKRYEMFLERKEVAEKQLEELKKVIETIDYKCWYYKTAMEAGTEDIHKKNFEKNIC